MLNHLTLMSLESDIVKSLDFTSLIKDLFIVSVCRLLFVCVRERMGSWCGGLEGEGVGGGLKKWLAPGPIVL